MNIRKLHLVTLLLLVAAFTSGCATNREHRAKSSVVNYLYPASDIKTVSNKAVKPSIPQLNIPLKVGLAFVPEQSAYSRWGNGFTEIDKTELLESVADQFRDLEFVSNIEVIPQAYLAAGGGFENLTQIKTMYDIDVIALVSYDQVQFTDEDFLSLSYLTIIGAYIVAGEKNDTNTMLDTVVYDISSKSMLFRAPGTSKVKGRSTPVNLSEELRNDSNKGYSLAALNMTENLKIQLTMFQESVTQNPDKVNITYNDNYSGGGSFGLPDFLLLLLPMLLLRATATTARSTTPHTRTDVPV